MAIMARKALEAERQSAEEPPPRKPRPKGPQLTETTRKKELPKTGQEARQESSRSRRGDDHATGE
jgi:hypothetical protein